VKLNLSKKMKIMKKKLKMDTILKEQLIQIDFVNIHHHQLITWDIVKLHSQKFLKKESLNVTI